jgi:hypothetical protein
MYGLTLWNITKLCQEISIKHFRRPHSPLAPDFEALTREELHEMTGQEQAKLLYQQKSSFPLISLHQTTPPTSDKFSTNRSYTKQIINRRINVLSV